MDTVSSFIQYAVGKSDEPNIHHPVMLKKQVSVPLFANDLAAGAVARIGCKHQ